MISRARFGPDSTATRSAGTPVTSRMISLARNALPVSMPFISETITVWGGMCGAHAARHRRRDSAGTDSTRKSAPSSATAGSVVAVSEAGSSTSGK